MNKKILSAQLSQSRSWHDHFSIALIVGAAALPVLAVMDLAVSAVGEQIAAARDADPQRSAQLAVSGRVSRDPCDPAAATSGTRASVPFPSSDDHAE